MGKVPDVQFWHLTDGWYFSIRGRGHYGPFPDQAEAQADYIARNESDPHDLPTKEPSS